VSVTSTGSTPASASGASPAKSGAQAQQAPVSAFAGPGEGASGGQSIAARVGAAQAAGRPGESGVSGNAPMQAMGDDLSQMPTSAAAGASSSDVGLEHPRQPSAPSAFSSGMPQDSHETAHHKESGSPLANMSPSLSATAALGRLQETTAGAPGAGKVGELVPHPAVMALRSQFGHSFGSSTASPRLHHTVSSETELPSPEPAIQPTAKGSASPAHAEQYTRHGAAGAAVQSHSSPFSGTSVSKSDSQAPVDATALLVPVMGPMTASQTTEGQSVCARTVWSIMSFLVLRSSPCIIEGASRLKVGY
jgi:hypothetical protein